MQTIEEFLGYPAPDGWDDRAGGDIRGIDSDEIVVYDDRDAPPLSPLAGPVTILIGPRELVLPGTPCSVREESVQVHLRKLDCGTRKPIPLFFSPPARRPLVIARSIPCGQQRPR